MRPGPFRRRSVLQSHVRHESVKILEERSKYSSISNIVTLVLCESRIFHDTRAASLSAANAWLSADMS